MNVVAATTPAPREQLARQPFAQRLVKRVLGQRPAGEDVPDGFADAVERLQGRRRLERLPGGPDQSLRRLLVGRREPGGEDGHVVGSEGEGSPTGAVDDHQLVQRRGRHVGAGGQRESRAARRRVLEADRGHAARAGQPLAEPVARHAEREHLLARERHGRRYQFGEVLGGGTSGSGVRATSTLGPAPATCSRERLPELVVEPVDRPAARTPNAGQRSEVGREEVDAVAVAPRHVLVVAQHAVAAVVDDDRGQRDLLLGDRGELAAGEQEAAVAGHGDDRPDPASAAPRAAGKA